MVLLMKTKFIKIKKSILSFWITTCIRFYFENLNHVCKLIKHMHLGRHVLINKCIQILKWYIFGCLSAGGHSAERYSPLHGYPWAVEDLCGHWGAPLGQGLGHHRQDLCLHESHGAPRGPGKMAGVHAGEYSPASPADHLPDQP